jgi:predicted amidohydrolase
MKKRITLAQINYRPEDPRGHVERIKAIIAENRASDLIVFPELILHGHPSLEKPEGYLYRRTERREGRLSEEMARFVHETDARVILGEIRRRGCLFYNLATYMDYASVHNYAKTHVHWTENFIPGRELSVVSTPAGRLGLSICYDSAFSEVGRILALRGAQVIVNISAVPKTFPVRYMRRRLSAMALNNQVFVIYVNRPGPFFSGHSAVFDPRGDMVAQVLDEETVFHAVIDLEDLRSWREEELLFEHRRPLLYRDIGLVKPKKAAGRRTEPASRKFAATAVQTRT